MDRLRQSIADGWQGREAVEFTAWLERIENAIAPVLGCGPDDFPAGQDYDYARAFRVGITASEVADVLIASAWRV